MPLFDKTTKEYEGRFADAADLTRNKFFKPGGIYIGKTLRTRRKLFYNGEGSALVFGKPEVGKTTKLVIPILLTYTQGSVVVTDPKATITPMTKAHRERLGNDVVILSPWRDELKKSLGHDYGTTGFNPLTFLQPKEGVGAVKDAAAFLVNLMLPIPQDIREDFFIREAQNILADLLVFVTFSPDHKQTLTEVFKLAHSDKKGWLKIAQDMLALKSIDMEAAADTITANIESEKQWAGVVAKIKQGVKIYDPDKPLGKHVERSDFSPDDLKRKKITLYIVCPSQRRDDNKQWLSLVMALCAEAVGRGTFTHPILLLAEEMGNLGYLPFPRFISELREAGLRVVGTLQSVRQLNSIYGQEQARQILETCPIKIFMQPDDTETAGMISKFLGTYEHIEEDDNGRRIVREFRPVMYEHQILRMQPWKQIILASGDTPPILARTVPFYKVPEWEMHVDENPLRPESQGEITQKKIRHWMAYLLVNGLAGLGILALIISAILVPWLYIFITLLVLGFSYLLFWRYPLPSRYWRTLWRAMNQERPQ